MSIYVIELEGSKLPYFEKEGFNTLQINVQDILTQKWMSKNSSSKFLGQNSKFLEPYYFVSPANSLGYMDGGIDKAYMGMFENIQQKVQKRIAWLSKTYRKSSKLGRPYLPIGSSFRVPVEDGDFLISAGVISRLPRF